MNQALNASFKNALSSGYFFFFFFNLEPHISPIFAKKKLKKLIKVNTEQGLLFLFY